jgi:hypothetical protein
MNSRVLESWNVMLTIRLSGVIGAGCGDSDDEEDEDGLHVYY